VVPMARYTSPAWPPKPLPFSSCHNSEWCCLGTVPAKSVGSERCEIRDRSRPGKARRTCGSIAHVV